MADSSTPAPPTEEVANLHLDEVTGERVRFYPAIFNCSSDS